MSRYNVSISATSKTIYALGASTGPVRHGASVSGNGQIYSYTVEGESSADVIDRVFDELEGAGATPSDAVRVSVRPVEVVKP